LRELIAKPSGSRNAYLSPVERQRATALSRALWGIEERVRAGSALAAALEAGRAELVSAGIQPEYLEARDAESLQPVAELNGRPVLIAVAAQVGGARLIDNVELPADGPETDAYRPDSAHRRNDEREAGT